MENPNGSSVSETLGTDKQTSCYFIIMIIFPFVEIFEMVLNLVIQVKPINRYTFRDLNDQVLIQTDNQLLKETFRLRNFGYLKNFLKEIYSKSYII